MKVAKIYKPCKNAMQSPKNVNKKWMLEYSSSDRQVDEIMGWTSSSDMYSNEIKMKFESLEEAIAYANKNAIPYEVIENAPIKKVKLRPYSSNFLP